MTKTFLTVATAAALTLAPMAAFAQESGGSSTGQKMKGPPNADGYKGGEGQAASDGSGESKESSGKMKGPPNANGASSDK